MTILKILLRICILEEHVASSNKKSTMSEDTTEKKKKVSQRKRYDCDMREARILETNE
jgi:hypothetical protein